MKKIGLFTLLAASVCALRAPAAIFPGGVVNAAGFTPFGLPNADIARGSLFLVFGTDLGAAGLAQAAEFPLPLVLAGTSVQVTVAGETVDCPVIFTTPGLNFGVLTYLLLESQADERSE